jgi:hypothetical protein
MDVTLLIDAIVRQTTVLIAELATSAGNRAPLAHTANEVFLHLVQELKRQGLGNKVIADMFGLALRTYHDKVQRLSESRTFRGRSLWSAVLQYVQEHGTLTRAELLVRFVHDDERTVRGIVSDLVDSGLVFRTGRGDQTSLRAAELDDSSQGARNEQAAHLLWVAIHRFGPLSEADMLQHVPLETEVLSGVLAQLALQGRVLEVAPDAGQDVVQYRSEDCVIPVGSAVGWEAAVFDHYQAMVTALCAKLSSGSRRAESGETIGGSTYTYDLWEGHPHEQEALGLLHTMRTQAVALRQKIEAYNAEHPAPVDAPRRKVLN